MGNNLSIDTIIFDAGCVLFYIKEFRSSITRRVLLSSGYSSEEADFALNKGEEFDKKYIDEGNVIIGWQDEKEWFKKRYDVIAETIDKSNFELAEKLYMLAFDTFQYKIYDETKEVLDRLKEKYSLSVLSNATTSLDWAFDLLDLRKYFKEVIISSYVQCAKPDKKIFNIALDKIGVQAGQCIFIDDRLENIKSAEELGFNVFHLERKKGMTLYDFEEYLAHQVIGTE
ncbi:HAD family hydrolase [Clostridium sp. DL1XJH146]